MGKHTKQKHKKRITVTVNPDDYIAFERLAREMDVTTSWLIRRSMSELLGRYRKEGILDFKLGIGDKGTR